VNACVFVYIMSYVYTCMDRVLGNLYQKCSMVWCSF
jgi:hypothetical protein